MELRLSGFGGSQRRLGLLGKLGKAGGIVDSNVSEDLSVEFDSSLLKAVDELRVAGAVELGGGGDADNPERTELTLLLLAAGVGKLEAALDGFLGCLVELGFCEEVTACAFKDLFAAVTPLGTAFYAGLWVSPFLRFRVLRLEAGGAFPVGGGAVSLFTRSIKP